MQVQPINNINFEKKRYVKPEQLSCIREITKKMNNEGIRTEKGNGWLCTVTGALKKDNVSLLTSLIYYMPNVSEDTLGKMYTEIDIGKSTVKINNSDGEIIGLKKGIFKSTKRIINKMDKYLKIFNENFDDEKVVTKKALSIFVFSEEAVKHLSGAAK